MNQWINFNVLRRISVALGIYFAVLLLGNACVPARLPLRNNVVCYVHSALFLGISEGWSWKLPFYPKSEEGHALCENYYNVQGFGEPLPTIVGTFVLPFLLTTSVALLSFLQTNPVFSSDKCYKFEPNILLRLHNKTRLVPNITYNSTSVVRINSSLAQLN